MNEKHARQRTRARLLANGVDHLNCLTVPACTGARDGQPSCGKTVLGIKKLRLRKHSVNLHETGSGTLSFDAI